MLNIFPALYLDIDDTLFDMESYIEHNYVEPEDRAAYRQRDEFYADAFLTDEAQTRFAADLESGAFMRKLRPTKTASEFLHLLTMSGYPFNVCTHRGYHPEGAANTAYSMNVHFGYRMEPKDIHALPSKVNKHEYLTGLHGSNYILIDDNAGSQCLGCGHDILVRRPWQPQQKRLSVNELPDAIPIIANILVNKALREPDDTRAEMQLGMSRYMLQRYRLYLKERKWKTSQKSKATER